MTTGPWRRTCFILLFGWPRRKLKENDQASIDQWKGWNYNAFEVCFERIGQGKWKTGTMVRGIIDVLDPFLATLCTPCHILVKSDLDIVEIGDVGSLLVIRINYSLELCPGKLQTTTGWIIMTVHSTHAGRR